jgi:hypothetical protein
VSGVALEDDGTRAHLTCQGAADSGFTRQALSLHRPDRLTLTRHTDAEQEWWCHGEPRREGNVLWWEDGTVLEVEHGSIRALALAGHRDEVIVGMGLLKLDDPLPTAYPLIRAQPQDGRLVVTVCVPGD